MIISAISVIFGALSISGYACGDERWPVKVVQDDHAKYFFKNQDIDSGKLVKPVKTSISVLSNKAWPFTWATNKFPQKWTYTMRNGKAEFTLWVLTAYLQLKKNEADEDYHLVLKSGKKTMIAEIPGEGCVADTPEPIKSMIIKARQDFTDWYAAQPNKKHLNAKVRVTGMGFFDRVHGGTGQVLKNGIELHPVIKIEFL